ncbi:MAG: branched-chain amino acid transporter permease [Methanomethylovorans sp.]|nr:branched-chain amino acid transporter permease [Methanomethylovorans sp.]
MTNEVLYLLTVITVVAIATFITRVLPFVLFNSKEPPVSMSKIEKDLPPMILLILVFYCLKDVQWSQPPYGSPEVVTIAVVTILHVLKRNTLLSIFIGTGLYMLLVQHDVFLLFFS